MKQLVIGIDGGDERILEYFDMPFYRKLLGRSKSYEMKEDRWSRGWAEMYTGMHARETNAFYEMPLLDGTIKFTRKFSWKETAKNPNVKLLWEVLDEANIRSVFMNIPTTFPAPKLQNGVIVAGAGGGLNNFSSIPEGLCSEKEIENLLNELNYVVDLRYKTSGITGLELLFEKLDEMMLKRAECFVEVCKKQDAEFGFLAFRATTIVQYLALSEIEILGGNLDYLDYKQRESNPIEGLLKMHFENLDKALEIIFSGLTPEHHILTADHGCVPFVKRVDVNKFLENEGVQQSASFNKKVKEAFYRILPRKYFNLVKSFTPKKIQSSAHGIATSKTRAFGNTNIHGVYINDVRRFNGVVKEGEELDTLVEEICRQINTSEEAKSNDISARAYRKHYPDAHYNDSLPDIWIDMPEIYFPEAASTFVSVNEQYTPIMDLSDIPTDVNSGQKGSDPLMVLDPISSQRFEDLRDRELTSVYHLCLKTFNLSPR